MTRRTRHRVFVLAGLVAVIALVGWSTDVALRNQWPDASPIEGQAPVPRRVQVHRG